MWLIIFCRVKCLRSSIKSCELIGNRADVKFDQYLIKPFSFKYGINCEHFDTTDTPPSGYSDLHVTLITPGVSPGVLDQPVIIAGGLVSTVTDKENSMVD